MPIAMTLRWQRTATAPHQSFNRSAQTPRKIRFKNDNVRFARQQQRKGVDIGRANGRPIVDHSGFGVQKAGVILDDFSPRREQFLIKRLLRPVR